RTIATEDTHNVEAALRRARGFLAEVDLVRSEADRASDETCAREVFHFDDRSLPPPDPIGDHESAEAESN
ncbi:MAG: hypothetical protein ACYDCQ_18105, partial [Dehalococcoidia bacterium]